MDWSKCSATFATPEGGSTSVPTINCIGDLIVTILNSALALAGMIVAVMIIFAGYKFITSRGDATALDSARKTVIYAIVGLFVVMLSYAFINLVVNIISGQPLNTFTIFEGAEVGKTGSGAKK